MKIELSLYEKEFIIKILQHTTAQRAIDHLQSSSTIHPDNENFIECELAVHEIEDLIGELSYEANHNRKKWVAQQACEIADGLEYQLRDAKKRQL
jgi:hypothetical protein